MKLYKLTDIDMRTYNGLQWEIGNPIILPTKDNPVLCSTDVIHAYRDMDLALLLNPIHSDYYPFRLFEAEGDVVVEDWGKCGCFSLILTKELPIPEWYADKKFRGRVQVLFAVLCAEMALGYYTKFAPNDNRPAKAIQAARNYLSDSAAWPAKEAEAAASAARAAAEVAEAARAAAEVAEAARADVKISFIALAKSAINKIAEGKV